MNDVTYKHPNEDLFYSFDFVDEIPSGDSIKAIGVGSATTVTAVDSAGTDASSTVVANISISGTTLKARLQAGTDGETYTVTYRAEMTTSAEDRIKILELRVRSKITGGI